jgi:hypothetical protein
MVKPAVVFGSATRAVGEMDMKRLGTGEREILRRIHGPVAERGKWEIRADQELRELCKDLNLVGDIKKQKLESIGNVVRMEQGRTYKNIF